MKRFYSKASFFILASLFSTGFLFAQNVGINTTGAIPHPSAGLDVDYANKGVLVPRVNLTGINDITTVPSPAVSLLVYNTGTGGLTPAGFYYYSGTEWKSISANGTPGPQGPQGIQGPAGPAGTNGTNGAPGATGSAGKSAYQLAVDTGYVGTQAQWLASLQGPQGLQGPAGPQGSQGNSGPAGAAGAQGPAGTNGAPGATGSAGKSAYQLAVDTGYVGTQAQWLASLQGPQGLQGPAGPQGSQGNSGPAGAAGAQGPTGPQGNPGAAGAQGNPGADGTNGVGVPTGGTTGQVLAKSSNADHATQWVTPSSGGGSIESVSATVAGPLNTGNGNGVRSLTSAVIPTAGKWLVIFSANTVSLGTGRTQTFQLRSGSASGTVLSSITSYTPGPTEPEPTAVSQSYMGTFTAGQTLFFTAAPSGAANAMTYANISINAIKLSN